MTESSPLFRVEVDLPLALQWLAPDDVEAAPRPVMARQLAARAREHVARMSESRHGECQAAMAGLLLAVEALEREVEMLHRRMVLSAQGLDLRARRVRIGGDGVTVLGERVSAPGQRLRLYLALPAREGEQLLVLEGPAGPAPGGAEVTLEGIDPSLRDLIVAFVFDYQRRERRRELDSASVG